MSGCTSVSADTFFDMVSEVINYHVVKKQYESECLIREKRQELQRVIAGERALEHQKLTVQLALWKHRLEIIETCILNDPIRQRLWEPFCDDIRTYILQLRRERSYF